VGKSTITWPFSIAMLNYQRVYLFGGLEHGFYDFPYIGMSSSQLTNSYFSEGLKPPTSQPVYVNVDI